MQPRDQQPSLHTSHMHSWISKHSTLFSCLAVTLEKVIRGDLCAIWIVLLPKPDHVAASMSTPESSCIDIVYNKMLTATQQDNTCIQVQAAPPQQHPKCSQGVSAGGARPASKGSKKAAQGARKPSFRAGSPEFLSSAEYRKAGEFRLG